VKECRNGQRLTHDNCSVGQSVLRTTHTMVDANGGEAIAAGARGRIAEHSREGEKWEGEASLVVLVVTWEAKV
jgi:hypothetical protein